MKILIVHPQMSFIGGAELVIKFLSQELRQLEHKVDILTLSVSKEIRELITGSNFILPEDKNNNVYSAKSSNFFTALGIIPEIIATRKLLKKVINGYDVINVHNFPCTLGLFESEKPVIWQCNEPPGLWSNPDPGPLLKTACFIGAKYDRYMINKFVDKIVVADKFNMERVKLIYGQDSIIIPYGIDFEFFRKKDALQNIRKKYQVNKGFNIIQVGVLSAAKNQLALLKAVNKLKNEIDGIHVIFAGLEMENYRKILDIFIAENHMENYVSFLGPVSRNDVRGLYNLSSLACFPTIEQGGWLSPFEALSAGVPVVVSRRISCSELIEKENLGCVTDDFGAAILSCYKNYSKYRNQVKRSGEWIENNLTWQQFSLKLLDIFHKAATSCKHRNTHIF